MAVAELLNAIRSKSVGPSGDRELLSVADTLEALFASQEQDLTTIHGMLSREQREKQEIQSEYRLLQLKYQALEEWKRIDLARRFGRSSERWTDDERNQAQLFNELEASLPPPELTADEPANTSAHQPASSKGNKPRGKRETLPDNLPRQEVRIDLPESAKVCATCGLDMVQVSEEISERLQVKPIEFYVERTVRPSYGCSCGCGGIKAAPVPAQVYPKSILGDTVIAQILVSKFCDALPFYRQERILARSGIDIARQTMARSGLAVAEFLAPLAELLWQRLERCAVICADETRLRVLNENGLKKEGNSYMWVATGEDAAGIIVRFHYGGGRGATVARELLGKFNGILMCDGYSAYPAAANQLHVTLAACMAHVRRQFHDILKGDPKNLHAQEALELIGALYAIERDCAALSTAERLAQRQLRSHPKFDEFRAWLYAKVASVAPSGALGKAVAYAVNLLPRLEVYLNDGAVPIDNNRAENAIRPFVVGRKNWLFNAEAEGATASAMLYSIIETAKANLVEPMHYLLFLFRCYRKFGHEAMPWSNLFPRPELRSYAETIGVPWTIA